MQRIVVALDSSPRAPGVLAAGSKLAMLSRAKLILYRAVAIPRDMPREVLNVTDVRLEEILLHNAREDLRRLAADVPPERIDKIITGFATTWDGICSTAKEEQADLIVIGSHGYSGLDRVLGTTATKVVNHAEISVLVVRGTL
jgi:nucleotide-binding universal stress UspA family protein